MPNELEATAAEASPLRLLTLGTAGLFGANEHEPWLGPGKPLALLMLLAFAPGRRASRESLVDLLWSDVEPDRARNALRQTLFQLRRLVGEQVIVGTEELSIPRPIPSDREQFLRALDAEDLEGAVALYGGDFLPSFGVPGGAGFEQWADLERDRLRVGCLRSAELLTRRYLNAGQVPEARRVARRVHGLLPQLEATGRLLLECAIAGGDFVTACMEADALEQRAAADRVPLESSTRALIARSRKHTVTTDADAAPRGLVAELTGREQEFSAITAAWDAVHLGPAQHVHLSAPAGLGKSRLLRDAVARLVASGASVVQLSGTSGDRDIPYAFAADMVAALAELPGAAGVASGSATTLLALNPALSTRLAHVPDASSGEEALRRRILAIVDLVHSVADEEPFVLAIDDLHWIDMQSYRVLEGVFGRLSRAHVLVLTAARPERTPQIESCLTLPLAPLSVSQVGALVSALGYLAKGHTWSDSLVERLHAATGGSPLLVLETLRLALEQGMLQLEQQEWRCLDAEQLATLLQHGHALRARVRSLPEHSRRLLALLALAGMPLERVALSDALAIDPGRLTASLEPLERAGLVTRSQGGWVPAHDEIAAAARANLDAGQTAEAERAVGAFMLRAAGDDPTGVLRAARHVVAAGDPHAVRRLFRRFAQLQRTRGDRREFRELAAEFLAGDATHEQVRTLLTSIPRWWSLGLWSTPRVGAAVAALLMLPWLTIGAIRLRDAGDEDQQRLVMADSAGTVSELAMDASDFGGVTEPMSPRVGRRDPVGTEIGPADNPLAVSPDGASVAWTQDAGDSTTLDIWLRTPRGTRRLTREFRDDLVQTWLPDGSALIGASSRWSPPDNSDYDIAVFDTASGVARRVTRGPEQDNRPTMSPDGTRVAFIRESEDFPPRVCVTTIDGAHDPECRLILGVPVSELLGWRGLETLILIADSGATHPLVAYDWSRGTAQVIAGPSAQRGLLSRDRRWVVTALRLPGVRGVRDWVVPIDHPAQLRPLASDGQGALLRRWWEGRDENPLLIDHLEFADTGRVIRLGLTTRLRIRTVNRQQAAIPLYAPVTWRSSDTLVATVDSLGTVRPRHAGITTITATLVGWRSVAREFEVRGEPSAVVLTESWDAQWRTRWIIWGDPQPRVAVGPEGIRGFFGNGDGSYPSFGVLRQALSARSGLGVEMRVSTPFTRTKWQRLRAFLVPALDTLALLSGSQLKSPPSIGRTEVACGLNVPSDGRWGATTFTFTGGTSITRDMPEMQSYFRSGAWWTMRLQILPDGRCGIAINDRVVWISPEPVSLDETYHLRLGDESAGTTLLHGPLTVWTGVRDGVDWSRMR